jgi:hypothetical protein
VAALLSERGSQRAEVAAQLDAAAAVRPDAAAAVQPGAAAAVLKCAEKVPVRRRAVVAEPSERREAAVRPVVVRPLRAAARALARRQAAVRRVVELPQAELRRGRRPFCRAGRPHYSEVELKQMREQAMQRTRNAGTWLKPFRVTPQPNPHCRR